jgi:hypothetical protein
MLPACKDMLLVILIHNLYDLCIVSISTSTVNNDLLSGFQFHLIECILCIFCRNVVSDVLLRSFILAALLSTPLQMGRPAGLHGNLFSSDLDLSGC